MYLHVTLSIFDQSIVETETHDYTLIFHGLTLDLLITTSSATRRGVAR